MKERKKEKDIYCLRLNEKDKKIDRQIYNYSDRQADGRTNG